MRARMQRKWSIGNGESIFEELISEAYEPIHPPDAIENNLPIEKQ